MDAHQGPGPVLGTSFVFMTTLSQSTSQVRKEVQRQLLVLVLKGRTGTPASQIPKSRL